MYSEPSLPLKSFPAYLEYITVFPGDTDSGFLFPSSSRGPGPTAITCHPTKYTHYHFSASACLIKNLNLNDFTAVILHLECKTNTCMIHWFVMKYFLPSGTEECELTEPMEGLSLLFSVNNKPPAVVCSASATCSQILYKTIYGLLYLNF